jgi:hypothetical protein
MDHWRRGGHKQICKKIHRGGNAEQYHADKKYKEAVAVAVEACAEDTKGQTYPEAKTLEQNLGMARMFQMMPRPGDARPAAPPAEERDPGYFMHQAMKHLTEAFDISHV